MITPEIQDTIFHAIKDHTWATAENTSFGIIAAITFGCSVIAAFFTVLTYRSQEMTQKNTGHLSVERHKSLLTDLMRHLYRNLVVNLTISRKIEPDFEGYPSEEHLVKCRIPVENLRIETFIGSQDYEKMSKLYLLFRNYNEELDIINHHLANPRLDKETKHRDMVILVFKACLLVRQIYRTSCDIWGEEAAKSIAENAIQPIIRSQYETRDDNPEPLDLSPVEKREIDRAFVHIIFGEEKAEEFYSYLAADVSIEMGYNDMDIEKVHIIKFNM